MEVWKKLQNAGNLVVNVVIQYLKISCNVYTLTHLEEFILSDHELRDLVPTEYLSHAEKYSAELRKACLLFKKIMDPSAG